MADDQNENGVEDVEEVEEDQKLNCQVAIEESGPWKKKIIVEIQRGEIDKELDNQYGELRRSADIPGFRKGRAPRRLMEKRYGSEITDQTKLRLLAQAFEQIEEEQDFEILGEPDFDPQKLELPDEGDFKFEYEIEVKPEFELPKLEGIKVEKQIVEISEDRVNETLDSLRKRQGKMVEVDVADDEDHVLSSVSLKIEGIDEPVEIDDQPLWVSPCTVSGVRFEDMGKVLKGVKKDDVKKTEINIPQDHSNDEYKGKKADLTINVKAVKRLAPAEVTEEFCQSFGAGNETDLKRVIEENLESQQDQESRKLMTDQIRQYLNNNIEFELPLGVAARHTERMLGRRYQELLRQGIAQEEIAQNIEQLRATTSEESNQELKTSFILEKVCDKLEIEVSDVELNGAIAQIASVYQRRPEKLRDDMAREGRLESMRQQIREEKGIEKILEMAEVVDAPETKPQAKPEKPAKKPAKKAESKPAKAESKPAAKKTAEKTAPKTDKKSVDAKKTENTKKTTRKDVKRKPPKADS